jgi:hypothetical protein
MRSLVRLRAITLFMVLASACSGGTGDGPPPAEKGSAKLSACDVLTPQEVEEALGSGELTAVQDDAFSCAYGSTADEAQVTFSVAELVGGIDTFEESRARNRAALGEERVRDLSGIGQGAYVVDNGSGSFFAQALAGTRTISIYIYVDPETAAEQVFGAAEVMLAVAVPNL